MTKVLIHGRDNRIGGADPIPPGEWVYVGDFPDDPNTTANSPPFQNGWTNAGGDERRLRFRRTNENQTEIAGSVVGGTATPSVVTTLPELYRVTENEYTVGAQDGVFVGWKLAPNGELTMLGSLSFDGGSDVSGIFFDVVNTGGSLTVVTETGNIEFQSATQDFSVSTDDITLAADDDLVLGADDQIRMVAETLIQAFLDVNGWLIQPAGLEFYLDVGSTFTIFDNLGNPIFRMTDGSPDIHIPAGGNVVADL